VFCQRLIYEYMEYMETGHYQLGACQFSRVITDAWRHLAILSCALRLA